MTAVLNLIDNVVSLYIWILFLSVIASWLINFNVINTSNRVVYMVVDVLYKMTEPALRPIRRLLPNMGGLDLSPVVLILLLWFIRDLIFDFARWTRPLAPIFSRPGEIRLFAWVSRGLHSRAGRARRYNRLTTGKTGDSTAND